MFVQTLKKPIATTILTLAFFLTHDSHAFGSRRHQIEPDEIFNFGDTDNTISVTDDALLNLIKTQSRDGLNIEIGASDDPICSKDHCIFIDDSLKQLKTTIDYFRGQGNIDSMLANAAQLPLRSGTANSIITKHFPWGPSLPFYLESTERILTEFKRVITKKGMIFILKEMPPLVYGDWVCKEKAGGKPEEYIASPYLTYCLSAQNAAIYEYSDLISIARNLDFHVIPFASKAWIGIILFN